MKKFEKFYFFGIIGIVTVIHLFAYRVWLFTSGVLTQGDWVLSLPNYSKSLLSLPIIWKSYSLGSIDLTPPFYPFLLLQGVLSNLGISYGYIERITFMWPIALLSIPFSYLLIKSFTKHPIAAFVGSLVYGYNTYFLILQSGQLTLMTGFTFAPLVLLFLKNAIEKKSLLYAVLTGLAAFVTSIYEFRVFYLIVLIGLFYYLCYLYTVAKDKFLITIKQTYIYALLPIVLVFLLNIYWILPYMFATISLNGTVFNRDLFGKEFFNISKALTLFHPFWTGDKYYPFITQPIPFYFFLLPILAFIGLYVNRKNSNILFYGLVSILGIFLVKQNNPPFPYIYIWLYDHFPGFGAFREASKFYFYVALGYSVLIGVCIDWILNTWKKPYMVIAKYVVVILTVALNVWNVKTLVVGTYGTLFVNRTIPQSYLSVDHYIDDQNIFFRTLWIPTNSRWGTNTDVHPALGEAETVSGNWKKYSDATKYRSLGSQFIDFYRQKDSQQLLNQSSIKYIIVPLADTTNDDNFFPLFGKSRNDYLKILNQTKYLKKVNSSQNKVAIYENPSYRPHIYTTNQKTSLYKNTPFKTVTYNPISNSEYKITIANVTRPFYLQFTDSFHPDWRIHVGNFHWYSMLMNSNYFLPKSIHTESAVLLNSFLIDPRYIAHITNSTQYIKNKDGSIDLTLTLYFVPQTYSYIGIGISSMILFVVGCYIVYYISRKYEDRRR